MEHELLIVWWVHSVSDIDPDSVH